jgi:hypothetical protein
VNDGIAVITAVLGEIESAVNAAVADMNQAKHSKQKGLKRGAGFATGAM